ncbi:MAG: hypothetical protein SFU98_00195 [Leptospiraceae bacterium]|nr:hypothetical protein [Leptospiraceae bacterium]
MKKSFYLGVIPVIFLFLLASCSTTVLKKPFRFQVSKVENESKNPIKLGSSENECNLLYSKRIHNILFLLPMNKLSEEEKAKVFQSNTLRFKNTVTITDLFLNLLGFLASVITYTVEIETCGGGLVLKNPKPEKKEEFVEIPVLRNYSHYVDKIDHAKENFVLFESEKKLAKDEDKKLESFSKTYKQFFKDYKILLISHSEEGTEKALQLTFQKASLVKQLLTKYGVSDSKIVITTTNNFPNTSNPKYRKRVDLVLFE